MENTTVKHSRSWRNSRLNCNIKPVTDTGTAVISRAEVSAALTKAVRMKLLARADAAFGFAGLSCGLGKPHLFAGA